MTISDEAGKKAVSQPPGDGLAVVIGCIAGALGGIFLGLLIAWSTGPGLSFTSLIIIFHVTVAMIAMGAWTAPSIMSDPEQVEGALRQHATEGPLERFPVEREPKSGRESRLTEPSATMSV